MNQEPDALDGLPMPRRLIAAAAVLAGVVLAVLDGAIANVALPTMATTLRVSASASVWIVSGYQMALVVSLLPFAALGEKVGYRRVFVCGVIVFTAASGLCAASPTLPWLVGARVLQGFGSAAVMSMVAALLRHTYPFRLLGTALGLNALFVGLASAAGPTLGALILSVAPWPWLFAVNIPIGLLVLASSVALPRTTPQGRSLDALSVVLNAGFFAPLLFGVDLLTSRPLVAAGLIGMSAVSLALLIRRETPKQAPLIPLDLLRGSSFRLAVTASVCLFAAQTLSFVALPFYLQHGLGLTAIETGLYMTPWPLTVAVAAPIAGRMADRIASAWLCAIGGTVMAAGLLSACLWPLAHSVTPLVVFTMASGLGFGFFQTPNNRTMLLSAPKPRSGAAGGMQATARQFGQTIGSVLAAVLLALMPVTAPRVALGVAAGLALAAAAISSLRIERARPVSV